MTPEERRRSSVCGASRQRRQVLRRGHLHVTEEQDAVSVPCGGDLCDGAVVDRAGEIDTDDFGAERRIQHADSQSHDLVLARNVKTSQDNTTNPQPRRLAAVQGRIGT
jgi:hypothetical protein